MILHNFTHIALYMVCFFIPWICKKVLVTTHQLLYLSNHLLMYRTRDSNRDLPMLRGKHANHCTTTMHPGRLNFVVLVKYVLVRSSALKVVLSGCTLYCTYCSLTHVILSWILLYFTVENTSQISNLLKQYKMAILILDLDISNIFYNHNFHSELIRNSFIGGAK